MISWFLTVIVQVLFLKRSLSLKMKIALTFILVATLSTTFSMRIPHLGTPSNGGKIWALLVAGSNGYYNYRHQADICHAYQILHSNGIPDENIVVMMYDDIAEDDSNPLPGKIINKPGGNDVYGGVVKDYTGKDVNKNNFLNILQGNKTAMKKIGSGKVIESGPNDHVFINFVDHGSTGFLCFPSDNLYSDELISALKSMSKKKQFKKLMLYIEACEAGSMFENLLPNNIKIIASTASNAVESSWGCYCDAPKFDTCLGDLYSVTWMEHIDKISSKKERKETIFREYKYVKHHVNKSHVSLYGDKPDLDSNKVSTFLGVSKKTGEIPVLSESNPQTSTLPSREIAIETLKMQIKSSKSDAKKAKLIKKLQYILKMRAVVDNTITAITQKVSNGNSDSFSRIINERSPVTIDAMQCYKDLIQQFTEKCLNPFKNNYMLRYFYILLNMCSMESINNEDVVAAFDSTCTDELRRASGIV